MFKKFLLVITTMVVLFTFVTYHPQKAEANGVSTVVSFAAKQALRAATKSAVNDTVGSLALKTATTEVAEQYVKKEGLKLVVLDGGKKAMVKTTFTNAEKDLLKKEIDNVIDLKIYGNTSKWLKYLDWFVGVGTVILVGQILYATINGDFSDFINEIFNEAMTNLGWIATPEPVIQDDPVGFPSEDVTKPIEYKEGEPVPVPTVSTTFNIKESRSITGFTNYGVNLDNYYTLQNSTFYYEIQPLRSVDGYYNPIDMSIMNSGASYGTNIGMATFNGVLKTYLLGDYKIYHGDTLFKTYSKSSTSASSYVLPVDPSKYNRFIFQREIPKGDKFFSYFLMQDSLLKLQKDILVVVEHYDGYKPSTQTIDKFSYHHNLIYNASQFPYQLKIGYFRNFSISELHKYFLPPASLSNVDITVPVVYGNKLALPNPSIFPEGYTYDPATQILKDPSGNPVTDPSTVPQKNPDPVIETTPDGEAVVDGVPIGQPSPIPQPVTDPVSPGGTNPPITTGDPKEINWAKLKGVPMILTKKFPFSLPWDAKRFMEGVFGNVPVAEEINFKIDSLMGIHFGLDIRLPSYFDGWFDFARTATTILFDIGLIYALYRLLGGAS